MIDRLNRVSHGIYAKAQRIACCARPNNWQHEIGPRTYAPVRESLTEILSILMEIKSWLGNVKQTRNTHCAIYCKASKVFCRLSKFQLQKIVYTDTYVIWVVKEISNACLRYLRGKIVITTRQGLQNRVIQSDIKTKGDPVDLFERIILGSGIG